MPSFVFVCEITVWQSWGFKSEMRSEQLASDKSYRDLFKLDLDDEHLKKQLESDPEHLPRTVDEVKRLYTDYLRKLYEHIEDKLSAKLYKVSWEDARIDFLFSVPSTWKDRTVERFRSAIMGGGFGRERNHSVNIDLTEAEAAAVFTAKENRSMFKKGDMLLVCDAGGGTTDISVLSVEDTSNGLLKLKQEDVVQGEATGSISIDYGFRELVVNRLREANESTPLGIDIVDTAWEMMKSQEFQNLKCGLGSPDEPPKSFMPSLSIDRNYCDIMSQIENGAMYITREDLRKLFNTQVEKIFDLIDNQLRTLEARLPNAQIAHIVLSGGLGECSGPRARKDAEAK